MSIKQTIEANLKTALLGGDKFVTETLRGLKGAILNEEVARGKRDVGLTDDEIMAIVTKECKKRDEAAGLFEKGGNQAAADKERAEKEILKRYLPTQLSDEALQTLVIETIAEINPEGMKDMGRVIAAVKAKTGAAAEPAKIAAMVKASLV